LNKTSHLVALLSPSLSRARALSLCLSDVLALWYFALTVQVEHRFVWQWIMAFQLVMQAFGNDWMRPMASAAGSENHKGAMQSQSQSNSRGTMMPRVGWFGSGRHKFWKVTFIVTFYSKYTSALTFQNNASCRLVWWWQRGQ
jgi:hypothetical protein